MSDLHPAPLAPAGLYQRVRQLVADAIEIGVHEGFFPDAIAPSQVPLERPRQASHGDLATNLAFSLAKVAKSNPRAVAERLIALLKQADTHGLLAAAELAGPGFVNLRLAANAWQSAVTDVLHTPETYGNNRSGAGERVLLEFVSANPTGPLHVGHGRGAVLGDALARVLRASGYAVATEYYVNNVGNQIGKLGESVWHWLRASALRQSALATWAQGDPVAFPAGFPKGFPEDGYRGGYVAQIAETLAVTSEYAAAAHQARWDDDAAWAVAEPENAEGRADNRRVSIAAWQQMLLRIKADLALLGIGFDRWFSERSLHGLENQGANAVADCAKRLQAAKWAYEQESVGADEEGETLHGRAVFFRGTREDMPARFLDSKDRVILRSDGRPTYFAADIAYHDDKLARGFDHLINILGADHHGYVPRLQGVLQALGDLRRQEGDPRAARWTGDRLEVLLVQMVALLRDGKPVPMGKRSGEFVTLRDVIEEVTTAEPSSGRNAVRFLFLMRKADAQLDFDLEIARRTSMDNPVYYVQYGHARLASVLSKAEEAGQPWQAHAELRSLALDDERNLCMILAEFPEIVARAAKAREPHQLAFWLLDTCRAFHAYYTRGKTDARVISDDLLLTQARLSLVLALKHVIHNGLQLLGVTAPDRMQSLQEDAEPTA